MGNEQYQRLSSVPSTIANPPWEQDATPRKIDAHLRGLSFIWFSSAGQINFISLNMKLRFLHGKEKISKVLIAPEVWIPSWLVAAPN